MKLKILFLALFVAGIAASIALASPSADGTGTTTTATTPTATTGTTTTGEHHKGDKGKDKGKKCHSLELKGTLGAGQITLAVDKANKQGRDLAGTTVTLALTGAAKVHAKVCGDGTAQTIQLTDLKLSGKDGGDEG
jgi:hypothetical protein